MMIHLFSISIYKLRVIIKKKAVRVKNFTNLFITFSSKSSYTFADSKITNLSPLRSWLSSAVEAVSTASFEMYAKLMLSVKVAFFYYRPYVYELQIPNTGLWTWHVPFRLGVFLVLP